jgi:hypothetical protein
MTTVVIVHYVSECDVVEVPGLLPMPYGMAVETLRQLRNGGADLAEYDLQHVTADGARGRLVSWVL